jgi:serine/threonine-protein kinase
VKILDFGISKVFGGERLTQTGQVLGTPRYMAPEQLSADRDLDARIDVYAMGVILYEALAGHPPFVAGTPSDLIVAILHGKAAPLRSYRPDLPPEVEAIVQRAMARSREARYPGMRALADAWEEATGALRTPGPDAPRPGMRTNVLGSMGSPWIGDMSRRGGDSVRPGTFSGLAATELPGAAAALAAAPATPPPAVVEPRASLPAVGSDPGVGASLRSDPGSEPRSDPGLASHPGPVGAIDNTGRRSAVSAVPPLRTSGSRIALIVGACIAGGLSAAAVIIGLQYFAAASEREERPAPRESPAPPLPTKQVVPEPLAGEVPVGVEPTMVEPPPTAPVEGAPEPPAQTGGEQPSPPVEDPAPPDGRREKRRDIRPDRVRPEDQESPRALLRQAREALNQRDYRACITLSERAMEAGAGLNGLRLRADCLYYSGDRSEALKAYERFCRAAPDHPSILEVAQRVLELGGTCRTEAPEPPPPPWTP